MTEYNKVPILPYHLQYFAKEGNGGEKTEDATSKKLTDARKEGQVAKSTELSTAVALMGLFIMVKLFVGSIGTKFMEVFKDVFFKISEFAVTDFNIAMGEYLFRDLLMNTMLIMLPLILSAFVIALIVDIIQVKWQPTGKPLQPKFSKLNPIKGVKNIISKDKLVELLKAVLKVIVISYVVYDTLKDQWQMLLALYDFNLNQAIEFIGILVIDLGVKISALFLVIGVADYFYQKFKFKNDMKMSKQEVKDEYKQSEGDPQVKSQIKGRMREASQRRMMQALPQADVVITNPTHFAVAIKYDKETSSAPVVIAKGADYVAQKIKDAARENKIEIVENKPLARMLYYNVDLDQEIPTELYQMVAEVLAYVYGLKHPN